MFNKPKGLLHDAVRSTIKRTSALNRLFLMGDRWFGYDRRKSADDFWTTS
ncbi:MAG: hypothetical protein K9M82_11430 [Deltaproteobacteria bacterium]|nr:hypothetical protein [Deltaproteobacteria bacterium]